MIWYIYTLKKLKTVFSLILVAYQPRLMNSEQKRLDLDENY